MNVVNPDMIARGAASLYFAFTYTYKDEAVNLQSYRSNFIIDVNGNCYQLSDINSENITIMLVGGIDKFVNARSKASTYNFFITEPQKIALYKIIKTFAKYNDGGTIDSNSEDLFLICKSLYDNYRG